MKLSRLACAALPLALVASVGGATAVEARPPSAQHRGGGCQERGAGYRDVKMDTIGQTWAVDFGVDTPLGAGPFVATIRFDSTSKAVIVVTKGPGTLQGLTQNITYTSTRLRPCQYAITWHEPKTGAYVTQVEDFTARRVYDNILYGTKFFHMTGKLSRVR